MQKVTPFLWFDNQAEEAMNFYVSLFKNSKILSVSRYGEGRAGVAGRNGHDRHLPARRTGVHGAQRRPALQVHRGHLALRQL